MKKIILLSLLYLCIQSAWAQLPTCVLECGNKFPPAGYDVRDYYDPIANKTYSDHFFDYNIYYRTGASQGDPIAKPILMLGGFDPYCAMDCDAIYALLNGTNNWATNLRNAGYDIIVVRWLQFYNPIQANALLLTDFIEYYSDPSRKIGNEPFKIIGASMGGLIGRYALAWMEHNNLDHHTSLFISLDAPHKGANMPLSLQAMSKSYFLAGIVSTDVAFSDAVLRCASVRQMLKFHILNLQNDVISEDPYHTQLFGELQQLNGCNGFPRKTRNVGIALGSLNGRSQYKNNGEYAVPGEIAFSFKKCYSYCDGTFWQCLFNPDEHQAVACPVWGKARLMPTSISRKIPIYEGIPFAYDGTNDVDPICAIDNCPGGYYPWFKEAVEGMTPTFNSWGVNMSVYIDNGTFIPTISALAYNTDDFEYNILADGESIATAKTPFDRIWWGNVANYEHIGLLPYSLSLFIVNELTSNTPKPVPTPTNHGICLDNNLTISGYHLAPTAQDPNPVKEFRAYGRINLSASSVASGAHLKLFAGQSIDVAPTVDVASGGKLDATIAPCSKCHSTLTNTPVIDYRVSCGGLPPPMYVEVLVKNYGEFPANATYHWNAGPFTYTGRAVNIPTVVFENYTVYCTVSSPNRTGTVTGSLTVTDIDCFHGYFREGLEADHSPMDSTTQSFQDEAQMHIYPNPGNGEFNLMLSGPTEMQMELQVLNSLGETVYTSRLTTQTEQRIDLSNLPAGIYLFNGKIGDKVFSERVVLTK